ncbi:MAG: radical SAM/SPASM domain-containing protein [Bacteroidetes bacterium]|nr:radical SAM/SPASM domain-containing protein [Bacteroidota bacterium]
MHIEFTDACNLKCIYCNNPHFPFPRKMMDDETFNNLITQIKNSKIDRICIGGGEATIHPRFNEYVTRLAKVSKILTIVTNGHWKGQEISYSLLSAPVDFIEFSVEAGTREDFEKTRVGSDYDLIIHNLTELNRVKRELKSTSHINLRLMVRPSQKGKTERESIRFWKQFGNTIMPQYVLKTEGVNNSSDVFLPKPMSTGEYPECSMPFRNIQIRSNGDVPICQVSGSSLNVEKKLIAGNINDNSINEIWQGSLFRQYRTGHRYRKTELLPTCKGCKGC